MGHKIAIVCISWCMNKYVYQIKGALENAAGQFKGLQVLVCDLYNFDIVDVPAEILDHDTVKYLEFRLKMTTLPIDIQRLPYGIQNKIRAPLGRWLDHWVLKEFYGNNTKSKSTNP